MKTIKIQTGGGMQYCTPEIQVVDLVADSVLCASDSSISAIGIDGLEEDDRGKSVIWY